MRIHNLGQNLTPGLDKAKGAAGANGDDFAQTLMDAIQEVNQAQADSRNLQNSAIAGQPVEPHDVMIAMERAGMSMQLTLQVRNKLLEAYQEINRMQV